ncbi:hypothetical protein T02_1140 [Trichinella nativa]|uniref:Uncharacterized protein n=1 Tax=Trichinella nativa TaxID=6335 RepID=A0A0V1KYY0_9BILA|nr:hypothetical protein T02_1140 [Trichinella nativa]
MSGKHVVAERNCVTGQKKTDAFLFTTPLLLHFAGTWLSGSKCEKLTASDEGQRTRKKLDRRRRRRCILVLTTDYKLAEVAAITAKPKMRVPKMKTQEMIPFAIASP